MSGSRRETLSGDELLSPSKRYLPVVIQKERGIVPFVRVPEVHPGIRVLRIIGIQHVSAFGMRKVESVAEDHGSRGEKIELRLFFEVHLNEFPVCLIIRHPVSSAVRGEKIVFAAEQHHGRIRGLPSAEISLILIVYVHGFAGPSVHFQPKI